MDLALSLDLDQRSKARSLIIPAPSTLGVDLWYDAADLPTLDRIAGKVNQWNDKSGNGWHATQPNNAKRFTSDVKTINGLNVLTANAGAMIIPTAASWHAGAATIFFVMKKNNPVQSGECWFLGAGTNAGLTESGAPTLTRYIQNNSNYNGPQVTGTYDSASPHIIGGFRNAGNGVQANAFYDGIVSASASTDNRASIPEICIGAFANWDTQSRENFDVGEICIFKRNLATAEKNIMGAYLSTKWGAAWAPIV